MAHQDIQKDKMTLTDIEKTVLEIFTSDAGAYEVVHKIVQNTINEKKDLFIRTLTSRSRSNEELGAQIRAFDEGMAMVDSIFRELGAYRKQPERDMKNPGK